MGVPEGRRRKDKDGDRQTDGGGIRRRCSVLGARNLPDIPPEGDHRPGTGKGRLFENESGAPGQIYTRHVR